MEGHETQSPVDAPTCYRHPGRQTYVHCTRCERPICGDCMRSAAVGHQCVECVQEGARTVRPQRTRFGGRERSGRPVVTLALIAVNVLAFIAEMAIPDVQRQFALWPPAVADGQYYRLVTSAFLHYGPTHLLLNMWALYVVGQPLEMWLGRLRFSALYAVSGLGGSVLVYLLAPLNTPTAGASGAVFGLFAATFVVAKRLTLDVRWVGAVIVVNLAFTFVAPLVSSQQISWQGHLGGLVSGAVIAAAYVYAPRQRRDAVQAAATVAMLVLYGALVWWRTASLLAQFS
ncbi:rhomboid family intramembrane serine protease [Mycobacterium sp. ML4]